MQHPSNRHSVAVIGAGPVGLAMAAHLLERGFIVKVFEAGAGVAANLETYRHVRLFSPWQFNVDGAARRLLQAAGWQAPADDVLPTAGEVIDQYLKPLADAVGQQAQLHFGARVLAVSRAGLDKVKTSGREDSEFILRIDARDGVREERASALVDASGTWGRPSPLGISGLPAFGEPAARESIVYGMPDVLGAARPRYAGRKVLVVGAGHSAAGSILSLARLAEAEPRTRIAWAVRGTDLRRLFGGGEKDGLPARGELGMRLRSLVDQRRLEVHLGFGIARIERTQDGRLRLSAIDPGKPAIEGVDEIIGATGSRPDLDMLRELRVRFDPFLESTDALAPLIDPNVHSCGTVRPHGHRELAHPERGFYVVGAKSYGRAPNFLMATGYEQARSVAAALAGDLAAADEVQLELPETGVCSVDLDGGAAAGSACCGSPAREDLGACCALDESRKAATGTGCGCAGTSAQAVTARPKAACCGG